MEIIVRNKTFTNKVKKRFNSLKTNGKCNPCYAVNQAKTTYIRAGK